MTLRDIARELSDRRLLVEDAPLWVQEVLGDLGARRNPGGSRPRGAGLPHRVSIATIRPGIGLVGAADPQILTVPGDTDALTAPRTTV